MNNSIDFLSLINDDNIKLYRPDWNQFTGSVNATLFLQQMVYWWCKMDYSPFYKFSGPCEKCKPGDSWQEELGFTRWEFEGARNKIAHKSHKNRLVKTALITYWTDRDNKTWYALNEKLLLELLAKTYPKTTKSVGLQLDWLGDEEKPHRSDEEKPHRSDEEKPHRSDEEKPHRSDEEKPHSPVTKTTLTKTTLTKTTSSSSAATATNPPTPLADDDDVVKIFDWMGFDGIPKKNEFPIFTLQFSLSWAWYVKIKESTADNIRNAVGMAYTKMRKGQWPSSQIVTLAKSWLTMSDKDKWSLINSAIFADSSGMINTPAGFPYQIDMDTFYQIWKATNGYPVPSHLMPSTLIDEDEPEPEPAAAHLPYQMTSEDEGVWSILLGEIEPHVSKVNFKTWLLDAQAETKDGRLVTIHTRNDYHADFLQNKLRTTISQAIGHNDWTVQ